MAVEKAIEVLWTPSAINSFDQIVQYLDENWTAKEVSKFVKRTAGVIDMLKRYPEMCSPSKKRKNVRISILNKHTKMAYHYKPRKKQLEILHFWSMKRNPEKSKYQLFVMLQALLP